MMLPFLPPPPASQPGVLFILKVFEEFRVWWWLQLCRKPRGFCKQGWEVLGSQLSDSLGGWVGGTYLAAQAGGALDSVSRPGWV